MAEANAAVAQADAVAAQAHAAVAGAEAANAQADRSSREALIVHLKLAIEKLRREIYGTRSERKARCWIRWSSGSKTWRRPRPRTS
jgi:hypothetical protein